MCCVIVTSNIFRNINHATKCYKGSVCVFCHIDEEMLCKCFDKCSDPGVIHLSQDVKMG